MLTVKLYGELGARYGRVYRLDVASPAEAVHALCTQLRGLRQYFIEHGAQKFRVRGVQDYDEHDLHYPQREGVLKIVPLVQGAGAWGKVIGGAALAVIGAIAIAYQQPWGAKVVALGVALALGGVAEMLAPRVRGTATPEKAENMVDEARLAAADSLLSSCLTEVLAGEAGS